MSQRTITPLRAVLVAGCAALFLGVAACSPIRESHGYTPRADELDQIQVNVDTRNTVQRKLGRPSTLGTFDDDVWLYISQRTETIAFYEREIVDQQVVLIAFNHVGVVTEVARYGLEDGRIIDLVSRETPTGGRRLTILQQVFQNVGRFQDSGFGANDITRPN